jgi:hypothetical protein
MNRTRAFRTGAAVLKSILCHPDDMTQPARKWVPSVFLTGFGLFLLLCTVVRVTLAVVEVFR